MPANDSLTTIAASAAVPSQLRLAYEAQQALLDAQPALVRRFIEAQAQALAAGLTQRDAPAQLRFRLPDQVVTDSEGGQAQPLPEEFREQLAGGLIERLTRGDAGAALRQRLAELEASPNRAIAVSAALLRHATAQHMIHQLLPAGRSVVYRANAGEEIPSLPTDPAEPEKPALTAASDAIVERATDEPAEAAVLVPFVPAARRFYLPQWVAFDDENRLLVNGVAEAQAHVASMQRFVAILHAAVALAPHWVADEVYQQKRYGMLGQLVNQGRALARYQTGEIVSTIQRRAQAQDLNRGLSLSLPYFDDQALRLALRSFEVIPAGRIMFVPTFVVRAVREEEAKVAQDTRFNASTRRHLLSELQLLEAAFDPSRSA